MDRYRDPAHLADALGDGLHGNGPIFRQLADGIAALIESGQLSAGDPLPAERALASALAVSRSTVVAAYDHLRERDLLESRRGSGSRVSARAAQGKSTRDRRVDDGSAAGIFRRLTQSRDDVISMVYAVDSGAPELEAALRDLLEQDLPDLLRDVGYHPRGLLPLRERVAEHLTESGLATTADQVVITSGAHQAIGLVAQMYLRPGGTVVVESPSWPGSFDLFDAAGAKVVGVPLDDEGISVCGLAVALKRDRPSLLFVMPTFHNPTGLLMSADRRRRVAQLAHEHGVVVVEDNAYNAALAEVDVPPPLAAFAPAGADVLTLGSLSKAVWGGLRIGWVRASVPVAERLSRHKALADLGSPVLDQALAARLLPQLPELAGVRAARSRERLAHVTDLLQRRLPDWQWEVPTGGAVLWVRLPESDGRTFAQVALRHGVEVVPGRSMDPSGAYDAYVRLPFSYPADLMEEAVERLVRAWAELTQHAPGARGAAYPVV